VGGVSSISDERHDLAIKLAGADMTTAPSLDAIKALPAVIVEPPAAEWIDGSSDSGPGRVVRYFLVALLVVNYQEPVGAQDELDDCLERVLERVPAHWRIDRVPGPQRVAAQGGEITALAASLMLSMRYSVT
jgi:hypothetical protein